MRICTLVESLLKIERVNSSMTDVATIHFNQIGCSTPEFTLVEKPTVDDRLSNEVLKSSVSLKQEVNNEQTNLFKF